jgi:hypothetical protein
MDRPRAGAQIMPCASGALTDQPVEQAGDLVGHALRGVGNRDHERGAAAQGRQRPEMPGRPQRALQGQPTDASFIGPGPRCRIDAARPRRLEPRDRAA